MGLKNERNDVPMEPTKTRTRSLSAERGGARTGALISTALPVTAGNGSSSGGGGTTMLGTSASVLEARFVSNGAMESRMTGAGSGARTAGGATVETVGLGVTTGAGFATGAGAGAGAGAGNGLVAGVVTATGAGFGADTGAGAGRVAVWVPEPGSGFASICTT